MEISLYVIYIVTCFALMNTHCNKQTITKSSQQAPYPRGPHSEYQMTVSNCVLLSAFCRRVHILIPDECEKLPSAILFFSSDQNLCFTFLSPCIGFQCNIIRNVMMVLWMNRIISLTISSSVVVRLRLRSHRKGKRDHLKTACGQRRNDTELDRVTTKNWTTDKPHRDEPCAKPSMATCPRKSSAGRPRLLNFSDNHVFTIPPFRRVFFFLKQIDDRWILSRIRMIRIQENDDRCTRASNTSLCQKRVRRTPRRDK